MRLQRGPLGAGLAIWIKNLAACCLKVALRVNM